MEFPQINTGPFLQSMERVRMELRASFAFFEGPTPEELAYWRKVNLVRAWWTANGVPMGPLPRPLGRPRMDTTIKSPVM